MINLEVLEDKDSITENRRITRFTYSIKFWCGWMAVMSSKMITPKLKISLSIVNLFVEM